MRPRSFIVFSGSNDRAIIAFLRALNTCGERAYIVARTRDDHILHTCYARDVVYVRDEPSLDLETFTHCINKIRNRAGNRDLVIMPSSEYLNTFLLRYRAEIESLGCIIPLVNNDTYTLLTNKRTSTSLFSNNSFEVPEEITALCNAQPPLIAKPKTNIGSDGKSLYPHFLMSSTEVSNFIKRYNTKEYFFQKYIKGQSIYLLFYIARSTLDEVTWSQRNLLQQPDGKSMILSQAASLHQTSFSTRVLELLRKKGFHGLGMIEIIQTLNRTVFIEMNPRIWGPIQFCLDQGVPILQAFIGEVLHDDPTCFLDRNIIEKPRKFYFWSGGLLEAWIKGQRPVWHDSALSLPQLICTGLQNDIYLRNDSWRCFLHELGMLPRKRFNREQVQT